MKDQEIENLFRREKQICITHQADTLIYKHHLRLLTRGKTNFLHKSHLFLIIMSTNNHRMVILNIGAIIPGFQIITISTNITGISIP